MEPERKYFGMDTRQLAILGGLGFIACMLFGAVGVLLARGGPKASAQEQSTSTPQFTATPFVLPSVHPTETLTPVPYELLIPEGWTQFTTALVEVWLPAGFETGDPKMADASARLAIPDLVLTGPSSTSTSSQILVVVSYELLTADSLDAYLTNEMKNLPADMRVSDRKMTSLNAQAAARLVLERRNGQGEFNDLMYVFVDGSTVWYVEYIAQVSEYFTMLDMFEKSARTFRMVR